MAGSSSSDPQQRLDSRSLRALCLDILGRPPLVAERAQWLGKPRSVFLEACFSAEELWENWLGEQLYYFLLIDNFRPEARRVRDLPQHFALGQIGVQEALHRIVVSASFDRRNPGPDTFVTVVMEQLLGLSVQKNTRELQLGRKLYNGYSARFLGRMGDSQSDVLLIAIEDPRTLTNFLSREYQRILRAQPEPRELIAWSRAVSAGDRKYADLLSEWLQATAYEERLSSWMPMPNRMFVQALSVDLTDRRPDPAEARRVRNALDGLAEPGPMRSVVARLFLNVSGANPEKEGASQDPTAWVRSLFDRLFSRSPTENELKTFVSAFHHPASTPETILYALVSHPEYYHW